MYDDIPHTLATHTEKEVLSGVEQIPVPLICDRFVFFSMYMMRVRSSFSNQRTCIKIDKCVYAAQKKENRSIETCKKRTVIS